MNDQMLKRILFALILSPLGSSIFALDCPSVPNTESFFPDSWGIDEANTRFVTSEDSQRFRKRASFEAQVVVWPKHHRTSVLPPRDA